jgi:hypothetical protein
MEILSNYLIKDYDEYINNFEEHQEEKLKNYLGYLENLDSYLEDRQNREQRYSFDCTDTSIIEHIEETNYFVKEQEHKFKIFDDISSVIKNKNNQIELVINIPKSSDIVTINKIKLSKSIKEYIFDIFVTLDDKTILTQDELYKKKISLSELNNKYNDSNIIDCSKGEVDIHIILEPNSINEIINNNIYISFSYINFKNKIKFYTE